MRTVTCFALLALFSVAQANSRSIECELSPALIATLHPHPAGAFAGTIYLNGAGVFGPLEGTTYQGHQITRFVNSPSTLDIEVRTYGGSPLLRLSYDWGSDTGTAWIVVNARPRTLTDIHCER